MLRPLGSVLIAMHVGASGGERLRAHDAERGAVTGVDHDAHAGERPVNAGKGGDGRDHVVDVLLREVRGRDDGAHVPARRAFPRLAKASLDGLFDGVVELVAAAREELDAVVGRGVVGGGEDDAEVGLRGAREVRDARGRQHANVEDVNARRCKSGRDSRAQELT